MKAPPLVRRAPLANPCAVGLVGLLWLAACGDSIAAEDFDIDLCAAPQLEGLNLPQPVDGLELRSRGTAFETSGTLCGGASSSEACAAALASAKGQKGQNGEEGIPVNADVQTVLFTRGDAVTVARTMEEVLALLGDVDTPAEARLVGVLRGYAPVCRLRSAQPGFEAYATQSDRCGQRSAILVAIDRAGNVTELDRAAIDGRSDICR